VRRCVTANSEHYLRKVLPDSDLILPADGELVVVRCTINERWYRAAVIGRDDDHNIKVGCVFSSISFRPHAGSGSCGFLLE